MDQISLRWGVSVLELFETSLRKRVFHEAESKLLVCVCGGGGGGASYFPQAIIIKTGAADGLYHDQENFAGRG